MLKAQGHTGFKAKAGGVSLAEDMERLAVVREVIGDDKIAKVAIEAAEKGRITIVRPTDKML